MKKFIVAMLALSLAACSSGEPQTQDDQQPTEEPAEQTSPDQQDTEQQETEPTGETAEQTEPADIEEALRQAANGEHRSNENIARNEHRNPVETLSFFGIERDMTVVELWPGGGWYTEVIAPVLTEGELIAATFAPRPEEPDHYRNRLNQQLQERVENEEVFDNVRLTVFEPPEHDELAEPNSVDMVLTFRNFHGWINNGIEDEIVSEVYDVLKPGGIFGVVQHRAEEGADPQESAQTGYVPEAYIIELAEEAGFELVDSAEINANPRDTKDHPEGVWTLPPSYRLGDQDREKYEAIGESDRMTLKFQKPESNEQ